jgi:hypothetical protein
MTYAFLKQLLYRPHPCVLFELFSIPCHNVFNIIRPNLQDTVDPWIDDYGPSIPQFYDSTIPRFHEITSIHTIVSICFQAV